MLVRSCVIPGCPGRTELEPDAHACPDCQTRLVRKLAEIEDYLTIVSPVTGRGAPGPRAKGFGSRPPLRLDVVAMLDPRTEINGDGPEDRLDEVPNVGADLLGWLRVLIDEYPGRIGIPGQAPGVGWAVVLIRTHIGWIATRPWVDEFAADIGRVHSALRQACGDQPPRSLGSCLDAACGGQVYRRSDDPHDIRLRCDRCRTTYSGLELVKIRSAS
jgi:hypothetical protein